MHQKLNIKSTVIVSCNAFELQQANWDMHVISGVVVCVLAHVHTTTMQGKSSTMSLRHQQLPHTQLLARPVRSFPVQGVTLYPIG